MKAKLVLLSIIVVVALTVFLPAAAFAKPGGGAVVYRATLAATNGETITGVFHGVLNPTDGKFIVSLHMKGLTYKAHYSVAITGFAGGTPAAAFPGPSADADADGFITYDEATPVTGAPIVWLEPANGKKWRWANLHTKISKGQMKKFEDIGLANCAVVLYGSFRTPLYGYQYFVPTAPAACGLITTSAE